MFRRPRSGDRAGTLLIEALLAITILAVSMVVITRSFVVDLRASAYIRDYTAAVFRAENVMFGLRTNDQALLRQSPPYRHDLKVQASPQGKELKQADLTIRWPGGPNGKSIAVSTLVAAEDLSEHAP